jgi:hypothetical protein
VNGLQKKVAFEVEIFRTLNDAKSWLGINEVSFA